MESESALTEPLLLELPKLIEGKDTKIMSLQKQLEKCISLINCLNIQMKRLKNICLGLSIVLAIILLFLLFKCLT